MQAHASISFNPYFFFIIGLMAVTYLLDVFADALNDHGLKTELPPEFEGIYDPAKYRTALEYQRENIRFDTFRKSLLLAGTIAFIVARGFNAVDLFARHFGLGPIWSGLIFVGALALIRSAANLPFTCYETFVIEEKYGFNKTTALTFVADLLKGALLLAILGGPIYAAIVYFFMKVGPMGWVYSWVGFTLFQLLLTFLAPVAIMPLFNKFEPLPESDLKSEIESFALKQDFRLQGIFKMDSSKRSTKSNAFFTGFGRFRRLVLFDTLIEKHTRDELVAVLAHEIGHFKRRHIQKSIAISILTTGAMFYALGIFLDNPNLFAAFGMSYLSVYASIVFVGFLYSPILRLLSILSNLLSRKFEFEADDYAVRTYGRPEILISALKKLSMDNLSNLTPHPLKVLLDYTHPPILQRIQALRAAGSMIGG